MAYAGENYPFRINIINKEGNKRAYFTSSFATDLDTVVSCSIMVNRINNMYSSSYRQDASGSDQNFSGLIDSTGGGGNVSIGHGSHRFSYHNDSDIRSNRYLSASFAHSDTGSVVFTDIESTEDGGLDYYEFYGTKVCSVLGVPEGIPIYTENFKLSDSSVDTTNYLSGEVISDSVSIKTGLKLSTQARMRSNLIWDNAFGEGYVQWVSGSTTKQFMGYDPVNDLYNIGTSQVTASAATINTLKSTTVNVLSNLNVGAATSEGVIKAYTYSTITNNRKFLSTNNDFINYNPDLLDQNYGWSAYYTGGSFQGDATSGTILRIDAGLGRVGINDTSPSYTLDVAGTFGVSGNITANGNIVGDGSTAISSMASLGIGSVTATGTVIAANPKFFAWKSSDQIILEDADRTIIFDTEIFDVGADYNVSNGIYTAPVDGKYNFSAQIRIDLLDIDANEIRISLVTSDATYRSPFDPNFSGDLNTYSYNINVLADMDANDTAYIAVFVADDRGNSTHVHGFNNVSFIDTFFSGHLVV